MIDAFELVVVRLAMDAFVLFAGCNGLVLIMFESSRS